MMGSSKGHNSRECVVQEHNFPIPDTFLEKTRRQCKCTLNRTQYNHTNWGALAFALADCSSVRTFLGRRKRKSNKDFDVEPEIYKERQTTTKLCNFNNIKKYVGVF